MKIFDCITFFQELDLLELRLEEHSPFVDKFVVTESNESFTSESKEYILEKHQDRFKKYWDKIIYNKIKAWPYDSNTASKVCWPKERWQKNQFYPVLKQIANSNDTIILSDLDEIIRKETIPIVNWDRPNVWMLDLYTFKFNLLCVNDKNTNRLDEEIESPIGESFQWFGPASWRFSWINENYWPQIRNVINQPQYVNRINSGGWHYSYVVSELDIVKKTMAYSHRDAAEFHKVNNIEAVSSAIKEIRELTYCNRSVIKIDINEDNSPKYLVDNKDRFKHLIA